MRKKKFMNLMALALVIILLMIVSAEAKGIKLESLEVLLESLIIKPLIRGLVIAAPIGYWLAYQDGTSFVKNFNRVILYNPPTEGILPFLNILLKILFPVYSLLIVSIGFYLLLYSSSPEGRANAKSLLSKLIITLVLISLSSRLIWLIFSISGYLTDSIFSLTSLELIREILNGGIWGMLILSTWLMIPDIELGAVSLMLVYVFAWLPYMVISLRNIVLTALMILFPLGILLYFIPELKSIGKTILEQFLIWTFIQAFMALALVSVAKAFSVTTLVSNPEITCLNIFPVPGINNMLAWFFTSIDLGTTNLMTLGFGAVAHFSIILVPIVMVLLFKKFLP